MKFLTSLEEPTPPNATSSGIHAFILVPDDLAGEVVGVSAYANNPFITMSSISIHSSVRVSCTICSHIVAMVLYCASTYYCKSSTCGISASSPGSSVRPKGHMQLM